MTGRKNTEKGDCGQRGSDQKEGKEMHLWGEGIFNELGWGGRKRKGGEGIGNWRARDSIYIA